MKNSTLALFAALILFGWTSLAAGVIAVFAGQADFSARVHHHGLPPAPEPSDVDGPAPLLSDIPCPPPVDPADPCPA